MGRKVSDTVWRYMIISPTMIQTERDEMTEEEKAIEAVRGLVSQSDSRRRFMERLESENREFKATIESMRAELLAEVQGAEDLLRDVANLKTNNKTLIANNSTLAGAVEHWRDAHRELTKINSDQAEIIDRLKGELSREKARVPPILSDVAALTKEITELKRQLTSVRTARDNQSATIRRQQDELSDLSDEISKRCTEVDELIDRNEELKATLRAYHDSTIKLSEWIHQVGKEDPRRIIMDGRMYTGMYTGLTIHDCVEKLKPAKAKDPGVESVDAKAKRLVAGYVPITVNEMIASVDDRTVVNALIAIVTWISDSNLGQSNRLNEHREDISAFCEKILGRIHAVEERIDQ